MDIPKFIHPCQVEEILEGCLMKGSNIPFCCAFGGGSGGVREEVVFDFMALWSLRKILSF